MRPSVARTATSETLGDPDTATVARQPEVRTSPPTRAAYASAFTRDVNDRPVYVLLRNTKYWTPCRDPDGVGAFLRPQLQPTVSPLSLW